MKSVFKTLLAMLALSFGLSVQAATDDFGTLLSGSFQPSDTFASLTYTTADNLLYNFTLTAYDLDALFTAGAFIGAAAVDSDTDAPVVSNVVGDTVVSTSPGGGPSGIWDFRFDLTDGAERLTANESVSWDATFSEAVALGSDSFALHVQGLTEEQGGSAWYVPPPIPEPETYAMMMAGLGLLGFTARRRKNALQR